MEETAPTLPKLKEKKKEDKTSKTLVVAQLPTQQIRSGLDEEGNEINLVTVEEALAEILEAVRYIKKGI